MANIKLYRNCEIREEKNFAVDDIERYLRDLTPVKEFQDAQYIKQGLDIEVKVKLDQTYLDREWTNMFNYCRIENGGGDDNCCYYFIRDKKWISKEAIKLVLHQDVINTYKDQVKLTDKTTIQREHKDRFSSKENRTYDYVGGLDDYQWEYATESGGLVGVRTFNLPSDFAYEYFTKDCIKFLVNGEPYGINLWEYLRNAKNNTVTITVHIQGEVIPQYSFKLSISYKSLLRNIDVKSEEMQPVLYKKNELVSINDNTNQNWYMVYTSTSETDPFACYLFPNNKTELLVPNDTIDNYIDVSKISQSTKHYHIVLPQIKKDAEDNVEGVSYKIYGCTNLGGGNWKEEEIATYRNNQNFAIKLPPVISLQRNGTKVRGRIVEPHAVYLPFQYIESIRTTNLGEYDAFRIGFENEYPYYVTDGPISSVSDIRFLLLSYDMWLKFTFSEPATITKVLKSINEVNRTYSQIVKIIELPYAPLPFEINASNQLVISQADLNNWVYNPYDPDADEVVNNFTESLRLGAITNIGYEHQQIINCDINPLDMLKYSVKDISSEDLRDDTNESKLYHSSYYQPKFVYDSFNYNIALENLKEYSGVFNIKYNVTSTINSRFLFTFQNVNYKQSLQDFDNIMYVNRSNEITVANSSYLDYLRNGYRYDQKAKELQRVGYWMGLGGSMIKGAATGALSGGGGVGAAIGAGVNLVEGISSGIIMELNQINQQESKEAQLKAQSYSVQGADDIDLMRIYTNGDSLQYTTYECSEAFKERVADLFYYCGYICSIQDVPDTGSRYWFNFVQCNPVYDEDYTTAKMSKDCLDELSTKYQEGITFLHGHYIPEDDETEYDFKQVKENWEVWLV